MCTIGDRCDRGIQELMITGESWAGPLVRCPAGTSSAQPDMWRPPRAHPPLVQAAMLAQVARQGLKAIAPARAAPAGLRFFAAEPAPAAATENGTITQVREQRGALPGPLRSSLHAHRADPCLSVRAEP